MRQINCDKKTDRQLVKQTLKNADHFECLMERYEGKLLRYIQRITNVDRETAEDILQEVFLKAYKNLHEYDDDFEFSTWIYRIAHNEAISFYRKQKVRPEVVVQKENETDYLEMVPSEIDLRDDYVKKELATKVHQIINSLPEKYKTVLVLKFLEERSYDEIADILQKPPGTIATLINRGKEQFKKLAIKYHLNKS